MKRQNYQWNKYELGTCYYPEHWDESLWESDLDRMLANGITTIRIAEFAWSKVEPREGEFTFEFWDRFLELCLDKGIKVIFCTPFATPPAWLSDKYPECLNCSIEGVVYRHGMRCNYTPNSAKFVELSDRITRVIAEHYGQHPAIIGWQIGNEQNCETNVYYSEADTLAFRIFLKNRYGTLDRLNLAWGTVFWNETYTEWEQVHLPRPTVAGNNNPHMVLDYTRFISDSVVRFTLRQKDILREYIKPEIFITTNGIFGNLDNHKMETDCLDVYTYDSYPNFAYAMNEDPDKNKTSLKDRRWSKTLSEVRSVCPHFGIMEQQSGANGWNYRLEGPAPKPGQLTLWAMQSIAHGADYISFFRWRTCCFSTEMYWHGILDYDNRDTRKLKEVSELSKRLNKIQEVVGADFNARIAVLTDYDNIFDSQIDLWHGRVDKSSSEAIFNACELTNTPLDYQDLRDDTPLEELTRYRVLIYPHAEILTDKRVELLEQFVKLGGILIFGARTGQKDIDGRCVMQPMPGSLGRLCGSDVKEYTFVGPYDETVYMDWNNEKIEAGIFNDILQITKTANEEDVKILARYTNNYYKDEPAVIETKLEKGYIIHFGGTFTFENVKCILEYVEELSPFNDLIQTPMSVELVPRIKDRKEYFFLLNYSKEEQKISFKQAMKWLDSDDAAVEMVSGDVYIKPFGVMVLKK